MQNDPRFLSQLQDGSSIAPSPKATGSDTLGHPTLQSQDPNIPEQSESGIDPVPETSIPSGVEDLDDEDLNERVRGKRRIQDEPYEKRTLDTGLEYGVETSSSISNIQENEIKAAESQLESENQGATIEVLQRDFRLTETELSKGHESPNPNPSATRAEAETTSQTKIEGSTKRVLYDPSMAWTCHLCHCDFNKRNSKICLKCEHMICIYCTTEEEDLIAESLRKQGL